MLNYLVALWKSFKEIMAEDCILVSAHVATNEELPTAINGLILDWELNCWIIEKCDLESEDSHYSEEPYKPTICCYENLSNTQKRVFEATVERYQIGS